MIAPASSTQRPTIGRGGASGHGTRGTYYRLVSVPAEPHIVRLDLAPGGSPRSENARSLLHLAHVTDLHVTDVESPVRFEFMERYAGGPDILRLVLPAFRPHEALGPHAVDSMVRTINRLPASETTGAPLQLLLCTGDVTDNAQWNELRNGMSLLHGGQVSLASGSNGYEGVQQPGWPDHGYWRPDTGSDRYKHLWGFPSFPGLLEEARQCFSAEGSTLPWLACYGNHDALVMGTALPNPSYEALLTGSRKAVEAPVDFDPVRDLPRFNDRPEEFLSGPHRWVTHDSERRTFRRKDFIASHLAVGGDPSGHGFGREIDRSHYVYDASDIVRLITIDATNAGGYFEGSLGRRQLEWLERQLACSHARYFGPDGATIQTGYDDRLVVLVSHHPLATMINDRPAGDDPERVLELELETLLHRFPNVILWLNGHTHCHAVRPRPDPLRRSPGFWEVTTGSLVDWPCQARTIELIDRGDGSLMIRSTVIDHGAPLDFGAAEGTTRLAAIHRELAANDPHAGIASGRQGTELDRNVELILPAPFGVPAG